MRRLGLVLAAVAAMTATGAQAAGLTIYTGGSMAEPLKAAGADFTRATGHELTFVAGTTGVIQKRLRAGEAADVVVISAEGLKTLQTEGLVAPVAPTPVAQAIIGVAVKAGAAKPDISTPEAFKQAMLAARTIAYPDPKLGATSGVYLAGLFDKMGIGPQMAAKTVFKPIGAEVAAAAGTGEVELAVTFISEMLADHRITVVGPLPAAIQNATPYAAGVSAKSAAPAVARAFITFVTSPAERAKLSAAGVRPAG